MWIVAYRRWRKEAPLLWREGWQRFLNKADAMRFYNELVELAADAEAGMGVDEISLAQIVSGHLPSYP